MVGMLVNKYFSVPNERDQNAAVTIVKGSIIDQPATVSETANAGKYYYSGTTTINALNLISDFYRRYSEETLKHFLDDGHPVCILRGIYDENNIRDHGHFTTIVGYTTVFIDGVLKLRFIMYDPDPWVQPNPWATPVITAGQTKIVSYQWISNSNNITEDELIDPDNGIWDGFVVVQTDYSDDEIIPEYN